MNAMGMLTAAANRLTVEDQASVEKWLAAILVLLLLLIAGLLALAVFIRYTARHSTQPCRWCMEFVSKKAVVCPHCGKELAPAAAKTEES